MKSEKGWKYRFSCMKRVANCLIWLSIPKLFKPPRRGSFMNPFLRPVFFPLWRLFWTTPETPFHPTPNTSSAWQKTFESGGDDYIWLNYIDNVCFLCRSLHVSGAVISIILSSSYTLSLSYSSVIHRIQNKNLQCYENVDWRPSSYNVSVSTGLINIFTWISLRRSKKERNHRHKRLCGIFLT